MTLHTPSRTGTAAFLLSLMTTVTPVQAQESPRRVALTFDDLVMTPEVGGCDPAVARVVNEKILAGLARVGATAAGFVNASRTCRMEPDSLRNPVLERWLDAGHVLGNHTWSHPDLEWTKLDQYLADARRGGEALDSLLARRGASVEWFRHPLLHAGDTPEKKRGLARFLETRGWRVAPVTVDNQEWVYAYVYHAALRRGETSLAERTANAFLDHLDGAFAYFERRSREVVGREIDQVLLLHANRLVADHVDEILTLITARGYRFIPLAEALEDPAYARGDPWIGEGGPSWIERWAVAGGGEAREGPREHAWVAEEFRRLRALSAAAPERVVPGVLSAGGGEAFPAISRPTARGRGRRSTNHETTISGRNRKLWPSLVRGTSRSGRPSPSMRSLANESIRTERQHRGLLGDDVRSARAAARTPRSRREPGVAATSRVWFPPPWRR